MPRGTHHVLAGVLIDGPTLPVLHVDGGGEWRLELSRRHRHLLGRRVIVEGERSDFDILDVRRIAEAPRER